MNLRIETELEDDGRWIAEVPELPGALAYGASREQAVAHVEAWAFRVSRGAAIYIGLLGSGNKNLPK